MAIDLRREPRSSTTWIGRHATEYIVIAPDRGFPILAEPGTDRIEDAADVDHSPNHLAARIPLLRRPRPGRDRLSRPAPRARDGRARNRARAPGWSCTRASSCKPKKGNIDLLFLGDSITQGWNENSVWKRFYGPRHAANFGIGGDRTQHVLWRIQNGELEGIEPKVTVLMIGTNNLDATRPTRSPRGSRPSSHELRSRLPKTKVLLLGVFPAKPEAGRRSRADQVGQREDRQARRRLARPFSRHRQGVLERRRHDLARDHARLSSPEHARATASGPTPWSRPSGRCSTSRIAG